MSDAVTRQMRCSRCARLEPEALFTLYSTPGEFSVLPPNCSLATLWADCVLTEKEFVSAEEDAGHRMEDRLEGPRPCLVDRRNGAVGAGGARGGAGRSAAQRLGAR
eukprot:1175671-Prorocentrum_minimum.AAC.5